ncbi:DUF397 domain-containing protein [Micromonospora sp. NPDC049523]|uniref:DUF397 domain-containing protein n=1 Tax=Micromonospora sp. NPDC049523 TaxID=3155921 RepID=UPI003444DD84
MERNVWRKSSRSGSNGQCVEAMDQGHAVAVRDSKDKSGPTLSLSPAGWQVFVDGVKSMRFVA